MPKAKFDQEILVKTPSGKAIVNRRFILTRADGTKIVGVTDANGSTGIQRNDSALEKIILTVLPEENKS